MNKFKQFFKDVYGIISNGDINEMMKNTDAGWSMKKFIGVCVTFTFCYLQIVHWSDTNASIFVTADVTLITAIFITHAVQQNTKAENKQMDKMIENDASNKSPN